MPLFLDLFRRRKQKPEPARLVGEVALADPYRLYPQSGFTPYNPSQLVGIKGLKIFDQMRKDEQVKAALAFKKNAVLAAGWQIESGEAPEEVAEFVTFALEAIAGSFNEVILHILLSLDYGYSVGELVYGEYQSGPWRGKLGIQAVKSRRPHEIGFRQDEFGNVVSLVQFTPSAEIALPPEKFVVHTYQSEFANPYGCSDLEAAYRPWHSKDMAYKWLGMLLERFGIPPIFALYNTNRYQGPALDNLKDIVTNLQAATAGIIPRNAPEDLEMWTPEIASQVGRVFIPALDLYDKHIAKALLIPALLGVTPEESVGSMARAQIVFDSFMLLVQKLRENIEDVVAEQIVNPLVRMNFAASEAYPRWMLSPIPDARRTELLAQWATMLGAGAVRQGPDDEAHIRKLLEFPENDDPITGEEEEDDPEEPDEKDGADGADDKETRAEAPEGSLEFQASSGAIAEFLDATEDRLRGELSTILERSRDKLLVMIEAKRPQKELMAFQLPEVQIRRAIAAAMEEVFTRGLRDLTAESGQAQFDIGSGLKTVAAALRQIKNRAVEVARNIQNDLARAVRRIVLDGKDLGDADQGTVGRIKQVFAEWLDRKIIDPKTKRSSTEEASRLATLVRNEATDAYNRGRLVGARDPRLKPLIIGMKSNAVLDERTTDLCRSLSGKVFLIDDPDLDNLRPPRHHNCRSWYTPVLVGEAIEPLSAAQIGKAKELAGKGFAGFVPNV